MAKQIKWTNQAIADRIAILDYFRKRNQSITYSKKLNKIFTKEVKLLSLQPYIGKQSNSDNVRIKVSGNYYIIYMVEGELIHILRLWDTRQNLIKLNKHYRAK